MLIWYPRQIPGVGPGMKRRVEEWLSREQAPNVGTLPIFHRVVPRILQAPLDNNGVEKRTLLDAVRLFQTVSGIGCVHVNVHPYGVTTCVTPFRFIRARKLAEAGARTLSDIESRSELFDSLPSSVQTALKYQVQLIERIPRICIEKIEALVDPLLTDKGFEVHFTGS
jgi:hypothetical protein